MLCERLLQRGRVSETSSQVAARRKLPAVIHNVAPVIGHHDQHKNGVCLLVPLVSVLLTAAVASAAVTAVYYTVLRSQGAATVQFSHQTTKHSKVSRHAEANNPSTAAAAVSQGSASSTAATQASFHWQRQMNTSAFIPMHLWRTSRNNSTSLEAIFAMQTWRRHNPNLTTTLHDDEAAGAFILAFYGQDVYKVFRAFPLGVMRADFWRYAVLYAHGGIYADIDTKCLRPVEHWFPPWRPGELQKFKEFVFVSEGSWQSVGALDYYQLSWNDCSIVVALENDAHFCQWVIASVAGHPILEKVLLISLQRAAAGYNITNEHMVHHHTGPAVWTEAVLAVLQLQGLSAGQAAKAVWTDEAAYRRASGLGVCIVAASFWGGDKPQNAYNMFGSQRFKGQGYPRWIEERKVLLKRVQSG